MGRAGRSIFDIMGCGPARPINFPFGGPRPGPSRPVSFSEDGPRPGPAHQKFSEDGPRPGPAHHISKVHGPAYHFVKSLGPARPITWQLTRALYDAARQLREPARGFNGPAHWPPMCCRVLKGACTYAGVIFFFNRCFFVVFFRLDSVGQLLSAYETTHNQYPLLTQFCSTNDLVGRLPVDHHLLVLLQRPQQQQQQQQHVRVPATPLSLSKE